jgi:CRISPR-associated Csx11 family protein
MTTEHLQTLRDRRALLLGCEAIGWVHMAGKARPDFLREHGGQSNGYDFKRWFGSWNPSWNSRMSWIKSSIGQWPDSLDDFLEKFDKNQETNVVGLLQAAHAMASGIEKNHPKETSKYLGQDVTHMWRSSPFGHPEHNLLAAPPAILQLGGWDTLNEEIGRAIDELGRLADPVTADVEPWAQWRCRAIGPKSLIRQSFLETLAETRIPNNDVTLWDQSYVAAALFKSAVAGAVLAGTNDWKALKPNTQWRVLVVGIGTQHYESRAVRIGDWSGARAEVHAFFDDVCRIIEVDAAVGSLVYRDSEVMAFTFPGRRWDATTNDAKGSLDDGDARDLTCELTLKIDARAEARQVETPPLVTLSNSTRSFISMAKELDAARQTLAVPHHKAWQVPSSAQAAGHSPLHHICPVCLVRLSNATDDKQAPCSVCKERRGGRLQSWLDNAIDQDTIWVSEVADQNDRVALLSFSLGLNSWLDGSEVDSLRAQSVGAWREHNPWLKGNQTRKANPVDRQKPQESLKDQISQKLRQFDSGDVLMANLQDGFKHDSKWELFFRKVVEDRSDAPSWIGLGENDKRAAWLTHQLFRKNASPGRIHRFWRTAEAFFQRMLAAIRDQASCHSNRWRVRRLIVKANGGRWNDRETYHGVWRDAPLGLVYRNATQDFVTITNLARCFGPTEGHNALENQQIEVAGDDPRAKQRLAISKVEETLCYLGAYRPIIPLELSPRRFRVLVPLDAVDTILGIAKRRWQEEFGQVWDRLPLHAGVVAFPRMTPFQAVVEATRNLEDDLKRESPETWRVREAGARDGVTAIRWARKDRDAELTVTPNRIADGREDVYYPYLAVEDTSVRFPRDFQHPKGQVYRHITDLRPGDGALVRPSLVAKVFLDSTARRFESTEVSYLSEFDQQAALWAQMREHATSMSALREAFSSTEDARERWLTSSTTPHERETWLAFVRAVFHDKLGVRGAVLDALVEAARNGGLQRCLRWNLHVLKRDLEPTNGQ